MDLPRDPGASFWIGRSAGSSRLPYLLRLPVTGEGRVFLATRETWPRGKDVFCHQLADDPMVKGAKRSFVDAKTTVDRRDWGLVWNMTVPQGVLVGHEIAIDISAEVMEIVAAGRAA